MLPGITGSNLLCTDRLKALDLPTILYRRRRGDLIQLYKYLNDRMMLIGPISLNLWLTPITQ